MRYVVSLSGGLASAVSADRAIRRYGRDRVQVRFADTRWEDEDLHRFKADLMARWGGDLAVLRDGRTPLQVAEDKQIIPNAHVAPCARELKIDLMNAQDHAGAKPVTVLMGLDWREMARVERRLEEYAPKAAEGIFVDFPLLWKPYEFRPYYDVVKHDWGIRPPRLYDLGFPHNNCGGRCVKQGASEWLRLRRYFPERFAEVRDWEQAQRAKGGARATFAILRDRTGGQSHPVTLAELEARADAHQLDELPLSPDDRTSCFCGDGEAS
jgi:hypothetical protein